MPVKIIIRNPPPWEKRPELLGDAVERAAKPIARALKLSCLDKSGKLKPQSPCGKRKAALNRWDARLRKWVLDKWNKAIHNVKKR